LLGVGCVDLDVQVAEHPVHVLVEPRRIERGPRGADVGPSGKTGVSEGFEADARRDAGNERDDRRPPGETATRRVLDGDGRLRARTRVTHRVSFPGASGGSCHGRAWTSPVNHMCPACKVVCLEDHPLPPPAPTPPVAVRRPPPARPASSPWRTAPCATRSPCTTICPPDGVLATDRRLTIHAGQRSMGDRRTRPYETPRTPAHGREGEMPDRGMASGAQVILDILGEHGTDCIFASPIAVMAPLG